MSIGSIRSLPRTIRVADPVAMEIYSGLTLLIWGAWTALPIGSLQSSPTFKTMTLLAPNWAWSIVMFVMAVAQLLAVSTGSFRGRRAMTRGSMLLWCFIAIAFFLGNPRSPGWGVYSLLAASQAWAFVRLGVLERLSRHISIGGRGGASSGP